MNGIDINLTQQDSKEMLLLSGPGTESDLFVVLAFQLIVSSFDNKHQKLRS